MQKDYLLEADRPKAVGLDLEAGAKLVLSLLTECNLGVLECQSSKDTT
jgi:hypothetical protein